MNNSVRPYLPYLRGKQAELLALREFAQQMPQDLLPFVMPVIEPVKKETSTLERTAQVMREKGMRFAVVMNPATGDFEKAGGDFFDGLSEDLKAGVGDGWLPAYVCGEGTAAAVQDRLRPGALLVFQGRIDAKPAESLACDSRVEWILDGTDRSRGFQRFLMTLKATKQIVRLSDCFMEQPRNADYEKTPDELFTEDPWYLKEDEVSGVADYTALPKLFRAGGLLPYAVAIHMTYRQEKAVRIHHFVSDSNWDQSNPAGKFLEAAKKAAAFYAGHRDLTQAVMEMLAAYSEERYPGLGTIKRWSIKNHLELMARILQEMS